MSELYKIITAKATPFPTGDELRTNERESPKARTWRETPYIATPLSMHNMALESDGEPYMSAAFKYVGHILETNLAKLPANFLTQAMRAMLEVAVYGALVARIQENSKIELPDENDLDDDLRQIMRDAFDGIAEPDALMTLFLNCPDGFGSLEIAKQTNATDWGATSGMDLIVSEAMDENGFERLDDLSPVRYSVMRVDDMKDPSVVMVVRKANVGIAEVESIGAVKVVQRTCFVLDLASQDTKQTDQEVREWLKNPETQKTMTGSVKVQYRGEALTGFIETQLRAPFESRSSAIVPAVSSYYLEYEAAEVVDHK